MGQILGPQCVGRDASTRGRRVTNRPDLGTVAATAAASRMAARSPSVRAPSQTTSIGMNRRIASRRQSQNTNDVSSSASAIAQDAETNLVFALARTTGRRTLDVESISDWQHLLQLASDENALIVLRDFLLRGSSTALPVSVGRYLAMIALDREYRMRLLEKRLEQSLVALNAAGIDVLLLKGSALACTAYGSFAARPMRDIDLLVRPERADDARALMLDEGWELDPEVPGDRSYGTHHHLPPLRDAGSSGMKLEIHRSLLPAGHPFRFHDEQIWRDARPVTVGSGHALVMHPAHHAVHVAIHFAWSHMLKMGAWHAFRDLDTLIASGLLRWDTFVNTAIEWGASSCCYWTLRLATALSDLAVPGERLRPLEPRIPEFLRRPIMRHFANGVVRHGAVCPSARLDQALWSFAMQPRRNGHGAIRPWLVSLDLLFALNETARGSGDNVGESPFLQMRRSSRYLTGILV